MRTAVRAVHFTDADGNPGGGTSTGTGFTIAWQHGALGRGPERKEPNGAFVEDVLIACFDRLNHYQTAQGGKFRCEENMIAMRHLECALDALETRTKDRERRQVEGTHQP